MTDHSVLIAGAGLPTEFLLASADDSESCNHNNCARRQPRRQ